LRDISTANLARIRESEERLAGIIRSSMEAIITVDSDQRIVLFNPMAESLFRCNAGNAIGRPLGDFIPPRYRDAHEEHVRRFGITGVSERQMGRQRALYALRSDGTEFPIEASISQTVDRAGKLYTVMLRDITERVRAEQALRQSREELQQLSDSVLTAREEEKRRIARELHDDLGQRLSALKMDLAMLGADLEEGGAPQAALRQVGAMHQVIDETVASVRRIASDLRPALLDELGPAAALNWLGKNTAERYGISVSVTASEDIDLAEQAAVAVFRIVQEALNNVVRHSRASDVEIRFELVDGQYELVVQDNGIGWDGRTAPSAEGRSMGLVGVRERARLLGGAATMEYRPGDGFRLAVRFPQSDVIPSGGKQ
jgi:PAS domain S-box-containing protein